MMTRRHELNTIDKKNGGCLAKYVQVRQKASRVTEEHGRVSRCSSKSERVQICLLTPHTASSVHRLSQARANAVGALYPEILGAQTYERIGGGG